VQPLVRRIDERGGVCPEAMPLLFEARTAFAIHRGEAAAEYEYAAGVGNSTIEFRVVGERDLRIECVSLRESMGATRAVVRDGALYRQALVTPPLGASRERAERSTEAQIIKAQEKIGEKVFANGKPTKFPLPGDALHAVLVDARGMMPGGGDQWDFAQIANGPDWVPPDVPVHFWEDRPIAGIFEESYPGRAGPALRERIHLIGFIAEEQYAPGELFDGVAWTHNPHLLSNSQLRAEAEALQRMLRPKR
jgi:hypothetical protein